MFSAMLNNLSVDNMTNHTRYVERRGEEIITKITEIIAGPC